MTFFYKRVFPAIWFGGLGLWTLAEVTLMVANAEPLFPLAFMLFVPMVMCVFGYLMLRALVFDLVDVAYLDQDSFYIQNKQVQQRIALEDVVNVNNTYLVNPERITLTLRNPGPLGREITFMAPVRFWPFGQHALARDLTALVAAKHDPSSPRANGSSRE